MKSIQIAQLPLYEKLLPSLALMRQQIFILHKRDGFSRLKYLAKVNVFLHKSLLRQSDPRLPLPLNPSFTHLKPRPSSIPAASFAGPPVPKTHSPSSDSACFFSFLVFTDTSFSTYQQQILGRCGQSCLAHGSFHRLASWAERQ